jgi:hypothetical protein
MVSTALLVATMAVVVLLLVEHFTHKKAWYFKRTN